LSGGVSAESCREATRNSLLRAQEKKAKSIAFPAIGTGVGGLAMAACARVMLETVRDNPLVDRVVFVLFDQQALRIFESTWNDLTRS
jgi:O-acetyl-ADP-ribose deacetylase (regulator of RNase III)